MTETGHVVIGTERETGRGVRIGRETGSVMSGSGTGKGTERRAGRGRGKEKESVARTETGKGIGMRGAAQRETGMQIETGAGGTVMVAGVLHAQAAAAAGVQRGPGVAVGAAAGALIGAVVTGMQRVVSRRIGEPRSGAHLPPR
jgi:hypothetical protein